MKRKQCPICGHAPHKKACRILVNTSDTHRTRCLCQERAVERLKNKDRKEKIQELVEQLSSGLLDISQAIQSMNDTLEAMRQLK